jgi:PadR family transcriptional regulator, regulatory protein PadR
MTIRREIILSFWKIHILHHAAQGPVVRHWMLEELREHGYEASPGTLYPVMRRMVLQGLLKQVRDGNRKYASNVRPYVITERGKKVLSEMLGFLGEMKGEVHGGKNEAVGLTIYDSRK